MLQFPTSTAQAILANISNSLADTGFLVLLAIAAGVPLLFFVVNKLIGLIPNDTDKAIKEADIAIKESKRILKDIKGKYPDEGKIYKGK